MARQGNTAGGLAARGKYTELRQRLLFVVGALLVFRIGTFIPVPGVNPAALAVLFDQQQGTILDMFNMFSGGALKRASPSWSSSRKRVSRVAARSPSTPVTERWGSPLSRPSVSPSHCRASRRAVCRWLFRQGRASFSPPRFPW